jgi:hypothetical protein
LSTLRFAPGRRARIGNDAASEFRRAPASAIQRTPANINTNVSPQERASMPDPLSDVAQPATQLSWHRIGARGVVRARSLPGGLHHGHFLASAMV